MNFSFHNILGYHEYNLYLLSLSHYSLLKCLTLPSDVEIRTIDTSDLPLIEHSRPGYSNRAKYYLEENHLGFFVVNKNEIAAMGWAFCNTSPQAKKVDYFHLPRQSAWFHADWTSEKYRGRGYHQSLIFHRIQAIAGNCPEIKQLYANIDPSNNISISNYLKNGFEQIGTLFVLKCAFLLKLSYVKLLRTRRFHQS